MRVFLFLLSALLMLQAPQPAAAFASADWSWRPQQEHVLPARHADLVTIAPKRLNQNFRAFEPLALVPRAPPAAPLSRALEITAAGKSAGLTRALPRLYDATGPPR